MRYSSNERGALSVLVVVLVVALLTAVGLAAYNLSKHHQSNDQSAKTSPSAVVSTSSPAVDAYAGWQLYKSSNDGISFKYPADWKIVASYTSQVDIAPSQGDTSFRVVFRALSNPSTQYDKSSCSNVRELETFNIPNLGTKKMIAYGSNGTVSRLALTDDQVNIIGQEAGCSAVFSSKGAGKFVDLSAWYGESGEGSKAFTFEQFSSKPEVQIATKILRSVSY